MWLLCFQWLLSNDNRSDPYVQWSMGSCHTSWGSSQWSCLRIHYRILWSGHAQTCSGQSWQCAKFRGSWDSPDAINRTHSVWSISGMSGMWEHIQPFSPCSTSLISTKINRDRDYPYIYICARLQPYPSRTSWVNVGERKCWLTAGSTNNYWGTCLY